MASTNIRDNVAVGEPDILTAITPTTNGTAQQQYSVSNVGAYATTGDGRGFRFAYDGGTALSAGYLYQAAAEDATNLHGLTCATVAVGDTSVSVTSTASTIAANALAGGLLTFTGASGGQTYSISGNTAAASSAFTITLSDPIRTALTTPSADCAYNPYWNIVKNPTTATSAPIGAAIIATSGTQYAWVQTQGVIALPNDNQSTISPGTIVAASVNTAGAITHFLNGTTPCIVGIAMETISGTKWGLVKLQLE